MHLRIADAVEVRQQVYDDALGDVAFVARLTHVVSPRGIDRIEIHTSASWELRDPDCFENRFFRPVALHHRYCTRDAVDAFVDFTTWIPKLKLLQPRGVFMNVYPGPHNHGDEVVIRDVDYICVRVELFLQVSGKI